MREIKFRAWDTDMKKMYYEGDKDINHLALSFDGQLLSAGDGELMRESIWYELMQYTGLKDKNEVYEGDIIKMERDDMPVMVMTYMPEILQFYLINVDSYEEYIKTHSNWIGISNNLRGRNLGWVQGQHFEVIGNIYENPELIKQ